jgi:uncharacterized membrane protein YfcA
MLTVALAVGVLVGLTLGALGGGGSILALPALVYLLAARLGTPVTLDWRLLASFATAAVIGAVAGGALAGRVGPRRLSVAFTLLLLAVATYTGVRSLPHLA